jgi:diguanylate cyclase (GGDEF)-like protein
MIAERVRSKICEHRFKLDKNQWTTLTCSIGVASYPDHGKDRQSLIRVADESMYNSKRTGKNRVTVTGRAAEDVWNR